VGDEGQIQGHRFAFGSPAASEEVADHVGPAKGARFDAGEQPEFFPVGFADFEQANHKVMGARMLLRSWVMPSARVAVVY
jgi:hypothetical protein